jgi:hypothetical protein
MMANQNTFLCECGRIIPRSVTNRHPRGESREGETLFMGLPWDFELGDPVHRGVQCGGCRRNWEWMKPGAGQPYVNVKQVK